jgi:hypothetical protein
MADDARKSGGWRRIAPVLLLLAVVYVLSVGPAEVAVARAGKGREAARTFYAPLIWLRDNTPLKRPLDWYVGLWVK